MNQMEIVTALMGVSFALSLAALVATPTLIGVYMELRALKRHGVKQKASGLLVAYPTPVPFNCPAMFVQEVPGKTIRPSIADGDAAIRVRFDLKCRGMPLSPSHHASSHTAFRSFGSWARISSASPGESCPLSAPNTTLVA